MNAADFTGLARARLKDRKRRARAKWLRNLGKYAIVAVLALVAMIAMSEVSRHLIILFSGASL